MRNYTSTTDFIFALIERDFDVLPYSHPKGVYVGVYLKKGFCP